MVAKRILCSERLRRVPRRFSWVDHRLVRDKHIRGISHPSLALYLFLVTVSDADGLSYYSDKAMVKHLCLSGGMLSQARAELCTRGLIAYSRPLYQVLSLDEAPRVRDNHPLHEDFPVRGKNDLTSLGDILHEAMGGIQ